MWMIILWNFPTRFTTTNFIGTLDTYFSVVRLILAGDLTYISFISKIAFEKGPISTFDFFEKKMSKKGGIFRTYN